MVKRALERPVERRRCCSLVRELSLEKGAEIVLQITSS